MSHMPRNRGGGTPRGEPGQAGEGLREEFGRRHGGGEGGVGGEGLHWAGRGRVRVGGGGMLKRREQPKKQTRSRLDNSKPLRESSSLHSAAEAARDRCHKTTAGKQCTPPKGVVNSGPKGLLVCQQSWGPRSCNASASLTNRPKEEAQRAPIPPYKKISWRLQPCRTPVAIPEVPIADPVMQ